MWYLWSNLKEILYPLSWTPDPEVISNIFSFKTMGATTDGELFKEKIKLASKVLRRNYTKFQRILHAKMLHMTANSKADIW